MLLHERVDYISCMSAFYQCNKTDKSRKKKINVDFPCQPYMSIKQCANIFMALSTATCVDTLTEIKIEAIIFFASYFQSPCLLLHAMDIICTNAMKLPHAIKMSCICLGYYHDFTDRLLTLACDHVQTEYSENIIELMKPTERKYHLNVRPTEYIVSALRTKIRDMQRKKMYVFSSTYMMCMICETSLIMRKKNNAHITFMPCCDKAVHKDCFRSFCEKTQKYCS